MMVLHGESLVSVNTNTDILELSHLGIVIFNHRARPMFANVTYKKMYRLDNTCIGLNVMGFLLAAKQDILEVLKAEEANSCTSVSINGLHGVIYRRPLRGWEDQVAGYMTESISISSMKDRIHEMQNIIDKLENYNSLSIALCLQRSVKIIDFDSIMGESSSMYLLKEKRKCLAQGNELIFILGENGTGKDLITQAIHAASL